MKFNISNHARNELENRNIPLDFLESVLENPQQIVPVKEGRNAYQSVLTFENGKSYILRAIVSEDFDPPLVITVYRSSKIDKYWRKP